MNKKIMAAGVLRCAVVAVLGVAPVLAQTAPELPEASPVARVEQRVGLTDFAVEYASPGVKGRTIWGELVPWGELWRTGANEATRFEASRDFRFGAVEVPAGTYALFTIPGEKEWTVILNANADASGTRGYDESRDVARITVVPQSTSPRERMTFLFSETTDNGSRLDLEWEKLRISVPIAVDTNAQALANIDGAIAEAWRPHFASARYLLQNGGDLATALGYAETSIAVKPTWWNTWVQAQILGKLERNAEAVAAATRTQELGKGDAVFEGFFAPAVSDAIEGWK